MRRSPFQSNSIASQLEIEKHYTHHKNRLRKIKVEDRKFHDLLPQVLDVEANLKRTRDFERNLKDIND